MYKKTVAAIISLLLTVNIVSGLVLFARWQDYKLKAASITVSTGKIQVEVLEANSNRPIDGATVCVIESRHYENTNKYGKTSLISVPIIKNVNFDLSVERTWGEVTLLVYKNGYADSINFYTAVMPNSTRVGIIIYLTPIISTGDLAPSVNIESPNKLWIESLIKLYKKR